MSTGPAHVDREFLARIAIFAGLPSDVLDWFVQAGTVEEIPAGAVLIAEGDPARSVFVVCGGELEICKRSNSGTELRVAILRPSDCVGEMSLIDIQPRSATVRALSPVTVFRLDHVAIARLYQSNLEVYMMLLLNIAREISRRLRRADQLIADRGLVPEEFWTRDGASASSR